MALPDNIRPQWNGVVQRMQGKACQQNGFAVLSISILVGPDGNPVWWLEPDIKKIEPINGSSQFFNEIMRNALSKHE